MQRECFIARAILNRLVLGDPPIDLDHERRRMAVEIDDKAIDDLLATKLEAGKPVAAQAGPQPPLRFGHIPPEVQCQLTLHRAYSGAFHETRASCGQTVLHDCSALSKRPCMPDCDVAIGHGGSSLPTGEGQEGGSYPVNFDLSNQL
jgi:hypothetical protein